MTKQGLTLVTFSLSLLSKLISDYQVNVCGANPTFWGRIVTATLCLFMFVLCVEYKPEGIIKSKCGVLGGLLVHWGIVILTSFIMDGHILHADIILIIFVILLFSCRYDDMLFQKMIKIAVVFLGLHCIVSVWLLVQGKALSTDYVDGIFYPYISVRLKGTQFHVNTLGGLSAATAISGAYFANPIIFISGLIACIFSQSKASLGGMILGLLVLFYDRLKENKYSKLIVYGLMVAAIIFILPEMLGAFDLTFTGRTNTWQMFIDRWLSSPVNFIFGLTQSTLEGRVYCENQYVQSLTKNGILGGIAFAFLLYKFYKSCKKSYDRGSKLPLLLFIMILTRCTCESYFASMSRSDCYFLLLLLVIIRDESREIMGLEECMEDDRNMFRKWISLGGYRGGR